MCPCQTTVLRTGQGHVLSGWLLAPVSVPPTSCPYRHCKTRRTGKAQQHCPLQPPWLIVRRAVKVHDHGQNRDIHDASPSALEDSTESIVAKTGGQDSAVSPAPVQGSWQTIMYAIAIAQVELSECDNATRKAERCGQVCSHWTNAVYVFPTHIPTPPLARQRKNRPWQDSKNGSQVSPKVPNHCYITTNYIPNESLLVKVTLTTFTMQNPSVSRKDARGSPVHRAAGQSAGMGG